MFGIERFPAERVSNHRNWKREAPPTPPPPPLPEEWAVELEEEQGDTGEPDDGLFFHNRKTIDATEWEATQAHVAAEPVYQVLVSGLPNKLLSDMMLDALFEQSGISEQVRGFKASRGKNSDEGQVLISLDTASTALWCACHFQGRNWGTAAVTAEVVSMPQLDEPEPTWLLPAKPLLPDAPEFVPSCLRRHEVSGSSWLEEATDSLIKERIRSANSSNASTRDEEESESGEDASKPDSVGVYCPGQ